MRSLPIFPLLLLIACGTPADQAPAGGDAPGAAREPGVIRIDGSSTVYPVTEAVAEEFRAGNPAHVTIGVSGTGGGFKKFCARETDISDASRPMKDSEQQLCATAGVEYLELQVAYDGISVVVHPSNGWVDHLTTAELKRIWEPEAQGVITTWSQVRPGFPDKPLALFGPGVDSGTFDYFTEEIVGKAQAARGDFTASEDDNVLVHGVSTDPGALGFFGFAYYAENKERLKVLPIAQGEAAPVSPSLETIADGSYAPLARPIFIYVSRPAAARPEVAAFVDFYLAHSAELSQEVGYVGLPAERQAEMVERWRGWRGAGAQGG
ncbi:MAG: PstS family phosphate ABC transporter substrate-binding protein [Pseudomonadota bacterium]